VVPLSSNRIGRIEDDLPPPATSRTPERGCALPTRRRVSGESDRTPRRPSLRIRMAAPPAECDPGHGGSRRLGPVVKRAPPAEEQSATCSGRTSRTTAMYRLGASASSRPTRSAVDSGAPARSFFCSPGRTHRRSDLPACSPGRTHRRSDLPARCRISPVASMSPCQPAPLGGAGHYWRKTAPENVRLLVGGWHHLVAEFAFGRRCTRPGRSVAGDCLRGIGLVSSGVGEQTNAIARTGRVGDALAPKTRAGVTGVKTCVLHRQPRHAWPRCTRAAEGRPATSPALSLYA
jgi:hypothetical protein